MMLDAHSEPPTLAPFDLGALDEDPSTIYALTDDLRISFVNRAWSHFARENGATESTENHVVGERIMNAIPLVLRPFYQRLFNTALTMREVVEHDYECSSPEKLRRFRMRVLPCESGLVVVHSPLEDTPHAASESPALESLFRDATGVILQCSHCRRVKRAGETNEAREWVWVPTFVAAQPANTSHGLCRVCTDYYYPPELDA